VFTIIGRIFIGRSVPLNFQAVAVITLSIEKYAKNDKGL
jgi:hypothetical protein